MNYGAVGRGRSGWLVGECDGAQGPTTRRECRVPAQGARGSPGTFGDMLSYIAVPVRPRKHSDPEVPDGNPVVAFR